MIRKLLMPVLGVAMAFSLSACSDTKKDEVETKTETKDTTKNTNQNNTTSLNQNLMDIDTMVSNDVASSTTYSKDKINEAVTYINNNIDNVKDPVVARKLYENGSYLEAVGRKGGVDTNNEIQTLGTKTKMYASDVYLAPSNTVDDIIEGSKEGINTAKDAVVNATDDLVDAFYKLINGEK